MGRKRKLTNGDIALTRREPRIKVVVVDYRFQWHHGEYRVIPLDRKGKRAGAAVWVRANELVKTGTRNNQGSVRVYRANERLMEDYIAPTMGVRGCDCQCCIHYAEDPADYSNEGRYLG